MQWIRLVELFFLVDKKGLLQIYFTLSFFSLFLLQNKHTKKIIRMSSAKQRIQAVKQHLTPEQEYAQAVE